MTAEHSQAAHSVRFEWGLAGARAVAGGCAAAVVVDVLSFSSTVSVGMDLGAEVLPYPWRDAVEYAAEHDAQAAVGRRAAGPGQVSLSPLTWRAARPARVVLPSPNGSTIAFALAESVPSVVAGCLRNARAVGAWLTAVDGPVCVIAAGEQWPEGQLRPALEDLLGAGAVLAALDRDTAAWSPEALAARTAWQSTADLAATVRDCASGRELIAGGFAADVDVALELDESPWVPLLGRTPATGRAFTRVGAGPHRHAGPPAR